MDDQVVKYEDELWPVDKKCGNMQVYTYKGVECIAPGFPESFFVMLIPINVSGDFGNGGGVGTTVRSDLVKPNPYRQLSKQLNAH